MNTATDTLIDQALHLPREDRELIAERMLASLDNDEGFDVSPAWMEEIARRCHEIDSGKVTLIPAAAVLAELRKGCA